MAQFLGQIDLFVEQLKDKHTFSLSLYENDSVDNTPDILSKYDTSKFHNAYIACDEIGTKRFGSVVEEERIVNLANARNNAVFAKDMYLEADYILFLDCDIVYPDDFIPRLLDFESVGLTSPDMYSGVSLTPFLQTDFNVPKYVTLDVIVGNQNITKWRVYDTWSMRRTPDEEWGTWKDDAQENPVSKFYGTFNSACLIKAEPFKKGIRYNHYNDRLGKFDLEHSVLAEKFHAEGYNEIWVNQTLFCFHI
jgi:glycosyltransferase involved in cell wall biosynthesis